MPFNRFAKSQTNHISGRAARRLAKLVTNDKELIGDDELHIFKLCLPGATGKHSDMLWTMGSPQTTLQNR